MWRNKLRLIVAIICLIVVAYFGCRLIISAIRTSARMQHAANLRALQLAIQNYHNHYNYLPPTYVLGPDKNAWHSWRVLVLPFLGYEDLYQEYRFDEPWDGPNNRKLIPRMPREFGPSGVKPAYYGVISPQTVWPGQHVISYANCIDGTAFTILLIQGDADVSAWTEPGELTYAQAAAINAREGGFNVVFMDGHVEYPKGLPEQKFKNLLCPSYVIDEPIIGLPERFRAALSSGRSRVDVASLQDTVVEASSRSALASGKTTLYCASLQLAWDEATRRFGPGKAVRAAQESPVALLNRHPFPSGALTAGFDVLVACGKAESEALLDLFDRKYGLKNLDFRHLDDHQIAIRAALKKELAFPSEFEEIPGGLPFIQPTGVRTQVAAFGIALPDSLFVGEKELKNQLFVRDYVNDQDFVLEFATRSPQGDSIILALTKPQKALAETWSAVHQRIEKPHQWHDRPSFEPDEILHVPELDLNLVRDFAEFRGVQRDDGYEIEYIRQTIQFRLNRSGALLISGVEEGGVINDDGPPPKVPRKFVFDRPFLLVLREKDAQEPYFLGWIASPEVMVPLPSENDRPTGRLERLYTTPAQLHNGEPFGRISSR